VIDVSDMIQKYISHSISDTRDIACEFGKSLKPGDIVCLDGDLGAGKTAFVSGFVKAFDYTGYVSSPTFAIVSEYNANVPIYHFDVYRLNNSDELYDIGLDDYLFSDGICLIEWAAKVMDALPPQRYEVVITKDTDMGDDYRKIQIIRRNEPQK